MPTLNKLEYLDETKQDIKNALNTNFNSGITDSTTFRNYVSKIKSIYTNWPKVTNEGTELSFTAKKGKMVLDTKGNTEQTTYSGKNLCNGVTQEVYLNTSVNTCGVASGNTGLYISVNGGNYTISTTKTQGRYRVACVNNEPSATAQTAYNGQNKDNTSDTITIDTTGYSYLIVNATDLTKIQIEVGSTATSYEPYVGGTASPNPDYPQDIRVVKGDNTINVHGKNLSPFTFQGGYLTNAGVVTSNYTRGITTLDYIEVKPNTDYTLSFNLSSANLYSNSFICTYDVNKTFIQRFSMGEDTYPYVKTIRTNGNAKYIMACIYTGSDNTIASSDISNWQFEKSSTPTTYQPYQEQTYPLNLGTTEVCNIGTYQDSFERDNKGIWGTNIKIGKVVLDGSESWVINSTYTNVYYVDNFFTDIIQDADRLMLCDYFTYGGKISSSASVQVGKFYTWSSLLNRFMIGTDLFSSVEDFKTWLSNNPVTVYYVLATPTGEEIGTASTSTLASQLEALYNAMSVDGTNIITSTYEEGNAPVIINATALMKGGN